MTDLKKGDKVLCYLTGNSKTQLAEVTDVMEKCVQVKYQSGSYSNLITLDKDQIIEKIAEPV
jgi:hypothetical protein